MLKQKCYFCKKAQNGMAKYIIDEGKTTNVCYGCQLYAERRFFRKISNSQNSYSYQKKLEESNYTPALSLIVVILIGSFIASYIWGNGANELQTARLFGGIIPSDANTNDMIRMLTSIFLQIGGPVHLLMNVALIIAAGSILEKIYGSFMFTLLFLVTGILGGLFVLIFTEMNTITGGASSSGYGLIGIFIGLIIKRNPFIDESIKKWVFNLVLINVIYTFVVPGISIAGHAGGLISGVILSLLVPTNYYDGKFATGLLKSIMAFAIVILAFVIPMNYAPDKDFTSVQKLREAFGKQPIYEDYYFSDELIYVEKIKELMGVNDSSAEYLYDSYPYKMVVAINRTSANYHDSIK